MMLHLYPAIFSAQNAPPNVDIFLNEIADYISKNLDTKDIHILSELIFAPEEDLNTEEARKIIYSEMVSSGQHIHDQCFKCSG